MDNANEGYPVLRYLAFATFALVFGLPLLAFFTVITWGAILLPLAGLLLLAPLLLVNYLIWGRWTVRGDSTSVGGCPREGEASERRGE